MSGIVRSIEIVPGKVLINGEEFPYWINSQGPLVEPIDGVPDLHILWLPLIAEGIAPRVGPPGGERLNLAAPPEPDDA